MQDYIDLAEKNGVPLMDKGSCQFCGAQTSRGIHECVEIFSLGFQQIDYSIADNHIYRFMSVDAHTLQHPEIHGRWNNHFHLSRQHLIYHYKIHWNYGLSPMLSDHLNKYKLQRPNEFLSPPPILQRGKITTTDVLEGSDNESECRELIKQWGLEVYNSWSEHHALVDGIAHGFVTKYKGIISKFVSL